MASTVLNLFPFMLILTMLGTVHGEATNYLKLNLSPRESFCLYLTSYKKHYMDIKMRVESGYRGEASLYITKPVSTKDDPITSEVGTKAAPRTVTREEVWYRKDDFSDFQLLEETPETGDYGFCFQNQKSFDDVVISFDYINHYETLRQTATDEVKEVYNDLLRKKMHATQRIFTTGDSEKHFAHFARVFDDAELFEKAMNKTLNLEERVILKLEAQMAHIEDVFNTKRALFRLDHSLMKHNMQRVNYMSATFCALIVLVGYIQIVVVRAMFLDKVSFKIWKN